MKKTTCFLGILCLLLTFASCDNQATKPTNPTPTNESMMNVSVGDIIKFGAYEQDNNLSNGKEEIEWIVLDVKDGKALIISKYGLDCQPYHATLTDITWETCTLRNWLNTTFYGTAFNTNQQSVIASTTLANEDNPFYETEGGNNTADKVFLLSISEAKQYFASDAARSMTATVYAKAQGAAYEASDRSYWWLRSPGGPSNSAAYVYDVGLVHLGGLGVIFDYFAVRPALWIDLIGTPVLTPMETSKPTATSTRIPVKTATPTATQRPNQIVSSNLAVGDIVKFGFYEQDNNQSNGQEEIEWIVLDKKDGKALLISKYGLDCQPYNTTFTDVTWETCTLRNWLNTTFYTSAFNANQQSKIVAATITNEDNPDYGTEGGNYTTDKVFLLSISEANQYFTSADARILTATAYAEVQGAYADIDGSYWWLRSPGRNSDYATSVDFVGWVDSSSSYFVDSVSIAVRPALWFDLES